MVPFGTLWSSNGTTTERTDGVTFGRGGSIVRGGDGIRCKDAASSRAAAEQA